jgi:hypothetical protein
LPKASHLLIMLGQPPLGSPWGPYSMIISTPVCLIESAHIGISARCGPAWVAQSVTALPGLARDQLTEEMGTAERLAPLLAAVARAVGAGTADRSGGYGGSSAI